MQALDLSCDRLDAIALAQHLEHTGVEIIRLEHMRGYAVIGRKRTDISRHNIAIDAFGEVRVEFLIEVLDRFLLRGQRQPQTGRATRRDQGPRYPDLPQAGP